MAFEKIPKSKWETFTQDEKDYHTLEFKKSIEERLRVTIIVTRIIAVFFIFGLIYMGYSQFEQAKIYDDKLREYGGYGHCALCGEYNLKRCECEYAQTVGFGNLPQEVNITKISEELAEYNSRKCESYRNYKIKKEELILNENKFE